MESWFKAILNYVQTLAAPGQTRKVRWCSSHTKLGFLMPAVSAVSPGFNQGHCLKQATGRTSGVLRGAHVRVVRTASRARMASAPRARPSPPPGVRQGWRELR
jgi:hypothetical protein